MNPLSSAPQDQKTPQITSGILPIARCNQKILKHSMPIKGTEGYLPSISWFQEHSASFRNNVGH